MAINPPEARRANAVTGRLVGKVLKSPVAGSNRQVGLPPQSTQYKAFSSGDQIGVSPSLFCDETRCVNSFMVGILSSNSELIVQFDRLERLSHVQLLWM